MLGYNWKHNEPLEIKKQPAVVLVTKLQPSTLNPRSLNLVVSREQRNEYMIYHIYIYVGLRVCSEGGMYFTVNIWGLYSLAFIPY